MKGRIKGFGITMLLIMLLGCCTGCADINPGEVGIYVKMLGWNKGVHKEPLKVGTQVYNPISADIIVYDSRAKEYDFTGENLIEFQTLDGQNGKAEWTFVISLDQLRVFELHQEVGPGYYTKVVLPTLRSLPRIEMGRYGAEKLYTGEVKEKVQKNTVDALNKDLYEKYGIHADGAYLKKVAFAPDFTSKLEDKAKAFQDIEINKRRAEAEEQEAKRKENVALGAKLAAIQEANGQKVSNILRADGDKQSKELIAKGNLAIALAEAQGIKARREALSGLGGPELVSIEWARNIGPNIKVGLLPTGSPGTVSLFGDHALGQIMSIFKEPKDIKEKE